MPELTERPRDAARRARAGSVATPAPVDYSTPLPSRRALRESMPSDSKPSASLISEPWPAESVATQLPPAEVTEALSAVPASSAFMDAEKSTTCYLPSRRSTRTAPRRSAFEQRVRIVQHGGILVGAAGLALAVLLPALGANGSAQGLNPAAMDAPAAPSAVSAAGSANVSFEEIDAGSRPADPDMKLHDALKVQADHVTAAVAAGTLGAPLKGPLVKSSPFGHRINPVTGGGDDFHTGQDFAVACGTEVYAAASGTVVFAGWHQFGGGNRVEIDHGNGLVTSYNHNSALKVSVGQQVNRGDLISLSGTTGNSTGCHLHFEVLVDKNPVDPMGWL